jgi:hypothetical protein
MLFVAWPTAQKLHIVLSGLIPLPQSKQSFSRCGTLTGGGDGSALFTSLLARCVSRVAGAASRASFAELDHNARVTHSANGATTRAHIGAVSDK